MFNNMTNREKLKYFYILYTICILCVFFQINGAYDYISSKN